MPSAVPPAPIVPRAELARRNRQGASGGTLTTENLPNSEIVITNAWSDCEDVLEIAEGFSAPDVVHFSLNNLIGAPTAIASVDAGEWPSVARFRWRLTAEGIVNKHGGTLPRFILCPQHDEEVLHLNGNDLDCRRANLKVVNCEPLSVRLQMNLRLLLEKTAAVEGVTTEAIIARLIAREFGHAVR